MPALTYLSGLTCTEDNVTVKAGAQRLDRLNRLWLAHGRAKDDGERGRKEWRLALEDIASPEDFAPASPLLRRRLVLLLTRLFIGNDTLG